MGFFMGGCKKLLFGHSTRQKNLDWVGVMDVHSRVEQTFLQKKGRLESTKLFKDYSLDYFPGKGSLSKTFLKAHLTLSEGSNSI